MQCCGVFVYVISTVSCALGCAHILLTLLVLYCVPQAHIRCKHLINTLLNRIILSPKFPLFMLVKQQ